MHSIACNMLCKRGKLKFCLDYKGSIAVVCWLGSEVLTNPDAFALITEVIPGGK